MHKKFKEERDHLIEYFNSKKITYESISQGEDPPDLAVHMNSLKIGIEHTRIQNQFSARNEAIPKRLCEACQVKLSSICTDSILVGCKFRNNFELNNSERDRLKDTLVSLVHDAWTNRIKGNLNTIFIEKEKLPKEVIDLHIHPREQCLLATKWTRSRFWSSGSLKESELITIIEKKHDKVSKIIKDYDQFWLFLVILGEKSSDFASIKIDDFQYNKDWNFDKIILFHLSIKESNEFEKHINLTKAIPNKGFIAKWMYCAIKKARKIFNFAF